MRKALFAAVAVVLLAGGGALAWWKLRPEPPSETQKDWTETKYEDISRDDMAEKMRAIGYVD